MSDNALSGNRAYPPDLGSGYSWPHGPECVYVLSRGIEWCTCRGDFDKQSPGTVDVPPSVPELLKSILAELESIDGRLYNIAENTLPRSVLR